MLASCPSCCSCCGCCCPTRNILINRLNYDGSSEGHPNFQLYNVTAECCEGEVVFELFEASDRRVVAFIPPVVCRVVEMQRVCPMDENVSYIVPEAEQATAIEAAVKERGASSINVFDNNPMAYLVFKRRNGRTVLRVVLENAHDSFIASIPVGTELRWLDESDAPVWWRTKSSWGRSMASVFSTGSS